ncbi:Hypothetical predicted protein [Pelobates cultripes]|nr:Hypothetical predicted protein [Pelobates cultripes]
MGDFASAHNNMADHVQHLEEKVEKLDAQMADAEDRARRNNIRLRGVPESVQQADLQAYVRGLLRAYAPDIPADMMLIDRIHRIPKPTYLPDSTPRDVLFRAHFFHIKELVLKASRTREKPHEDYPAVKLFNDLSAATLRKRRTFHQVAEALRQHRTKYRWGYPTKMLVQHGGTLRPISTPEEGIKLLKEWNIPIPSTEPHRHPIRKTTQEWSKARKRLI